MRKLISVLVLALSACVSQLTPPAVYPEAELAPGYILTPIRRAMGHDVVFTNATVVCDGLMEVEGYRSDGAYKFTLVRQDEIWVLSNTERVGPAPR